MSPFFFLSPFSSPVFLPNIRYVPVFLPPNRARKGRHRAQVMGRFAPPLQGSVGRAVAAVPGR